MNEEKYTLEEVIEFARDVLAIVAGATFEDGISEDFKEGFYWFAKYANQKLDNAIEIFNKGEGV